MRDGISRFEGQKVEQPVEVFVLVERSGKPGASRVEAFARLAPLHCKALTGGLP